MWLINAHALNTLFRPGQIWTTLHNFDIWGKNGYRLHTYTYTQHYRYIISPILNLRFNSKIVKCTPL